MEAIIYNVIAALCVLVFITLCVIIFSKGKSMEAYYFGTLIAAGGAFGGGARARKKIKELEKLPTRKRYSRTF